LIARVVSLQKYLVFAQIEVAMQKIDSETPLLSVLLQDLCDLSQAEFIFNAKVMLYSIDSR